MSQDIDWNDVESAEAREDGLHIKKKDGTLGIVLSTKPVGQNLQRVNFCRVIGAVLDNMSKALNQLLQTKALIDGNPNNPPPAGTKEQLDAAIAACKANIAHVQDIARKNGCG